MNIELAHFPVFEQTFPTIEEKELAAIYVTKDQRKAQEPCID